MRQDREMLDLLLRTLWVKRHPISLHSAHVASNAGIPKIIVSKIRDKHTTTTHGGFLYIHIYIYIQIAKVIVK